MPNYRRGANKQKILYYSITAAIIIVAVILLLGPLSGKDKPAVEPGPVKEAIKFETLPIQPAPEVAEVPEETALNTEYGKLLTDANSTTNSRVLSLLAQAQDNISKRKIIAARNMLNDVFAMPLTPVVRENLRKQMAVLAEQWLFNKAVLIGDNLCGTYRVRPGDVLSVIARQHKVPYELLMKINNISNPKSLQVGQALKVVNGPFHVIAYCSDFSMDLYLQNTYIRSYKIGTGKEGKDTPLGRWRVKAGGKLVRPTWTDPETNVTYNANDPGYPLGSGYIALEGIEPKTKDISGIAIHGTKDEETISTRSSGGCIRLFNGDLIELFNMLESGYSEVNILE